MDRELVGKLMLLLDTSNEIANLCMPAFDVVIIHEFGESHESVFSDNFTLFDHKVYAR